MALDLDKQLVRIHVATIHLVLHPPVIESVPACFPRARG